MLNIHLSIQFCHQLPLHLQTVKFIDREVYMVVFRDDFSVTVNGKCWLKD